MEIQRGVNDSKLIDGHPSPFLSVKPLYANYTDAPFYGVSLGAGIVGGNTSMLLSIGGTWNTTWRYDPDLSITLGASGDSAVRNSGDGGTSMLYIILPAVLVPLLCVVALGVVMIAFIATAVLRRRSAATEKRVNF